MKQKTMITRLGTLLLLGNGINLLCVTTGHALELAASLQWSKRVELATPVSGVIKSVQANIGDRVKQGDVLVKLDERNYAAALEMARAKVKSLDEKRKEAKRQLDRAQELYNRTVLSEHELQTAKNGKVEADSDYATAKSELVSAEFNLEYTILRAPFDAVVLQRNAEVGQTVVSQLKPEVLFILGSAGEMIARGLIAQSDLNGSLQGRSASVNVTGKRYEGKVRHVGLEPMQTDKQGIYYEIAVVFNPGERILRAGQQVTISLP